MNYLEQARKYEEKYSNTISDEERPLYHITPAIGWLNDPNGFSWYNGKYHLFYQYMPYQTRWSPMMHWGHVESEDLIHWERKPVFMAPEADYETGCYSGSAIIDPDGSHLIMYTAHYQSLPDEDAENPIFEESVETQCIIKGDGTTYERLPENPVIGIHDMPEGGKPADFRDPCIWYENGEYFCVLAIRMLETGLGSIVIYKSYDTVNWEYRGVLMKNDGRFGQMWECPDFFEVDKKSVLILSATDVQNFDPCFRGGHCAYAFIGDYDKIGMDFRDDSCQNLDLGFDFYAPQTILTPDGRRVLIAWMADPDGAKCAPTGYKWNGQMTFPRELRIKDGHLYQMPIREIEECYDSAVSATGQAADETSFDGIRGKAVDITVEADGKGKYLKDFCMKFAVDDKDPDRKYVSIEYDGVTNRLVVDRSHAGRTASIENRREVEIRGEENGKKLKLRVLLDRFSFEIFVNDGSEVLSGTLYESDPAWDGITFKAPDAELNIVCLTLKY